MATYGEVLRVGVTPNPDGTIALLLFPFQGYYRVISFLFLLYNYFCFTLRIDCSH